ncbi:hypothetical protein M1349_03975 [Patescibacteria group bacterium]|nr:hypothetical protein [Patescibacteria group bacterium]
MSAKAENDIFLEEGVLNTQFLKNSLLARLKEVSTRQMSYGYGLGDRLYSSTHPEDQKLASEMRGFIGGLKDLFKTRNIEVDDQSANPDQLTDSMVLGGFMFALDHGTAHISGKPTSPERRADFKKWAEGALLGYTANQALGVLLSGDDQSVRTRIHQALCAF